MKRKLPIIVGDVVRIIDHDRFCEIRKSGYVERLWWTTEMDRAFGAECEVTNVYTDEEDFHAKGDSHPTGYFEFSIDMVDERLHFNMAMVDKVLNLDDIPEVSKDDFFATLIHR